MLETILNYAVLFSSILSFVLAPAPLLIRSKRVLGRFALALVFAEFLAVAMLCAMLEQKAHDTDGPWVIVAGGLLLFPPVIFLFSLGLRWVYLAIWRLSRNL